MELETQDMTSQLLMSGVHTSVSSIQSSLNQLLSAQVLCARARSGQPVPVFSSVGIGSPHSGPIASQPSGMCAGYVAHPSKIWVAVLGNDGTGGTPPNPP